MQKSREKELPDLVEVVELDLKGEALERVEKDLMVLNNYKSKLLLQPSVVYDERIEKIDYHLSKKLGDSMRNHLLEVKAKIIEDGKNVFIQKEKTRIDVDLVKKNVEKDELISGN